MDFKTWLLPENHNACLEARAWVGDMTAPEAWAKCERGDWMGWLIDEAGLMEKNRLRLMLCDLVEHVLIDSDVGTRASIEATRRAVRGEGTEEDAAGEAWAAREARAARAAGAAGEARAAELKWQADKIREYLPMIPELGVISPAKTGG